jgi:rare lipoprotein A
VNVRTILAAIMLTAIAWGCAPAPRFTSFRVGAGQTGGSAEYVGDSADVPEKPAVGTKIRGLASFYADKYDGKATSNGEIFDMNGLTCAHKTLAFDTWLEVRNLANNRTVIVRVNDRGPFIEGRIIDLSLGAAKALDMVLTGVQEVECTVIK